MVFVVVAGACGSSVADSERGFTAAEVDALLMSETATLDDEPARLADHIDGAAVVWLYTPWCRSCERDAAMIAEVASSAQIPVVIVGGRAGAAAMRIFVEEHGLDAATAVVRDGDGSLFGQVRVQSPPAWLFIAADGSATVVPDRLDRADIVDRLAEL